MLDVIYDMESILNSLVNGISVASYSIMAGPFSVAQNSHVTTEIILTRENTIRETFR